MNGTIAKPVFRSNAPLSAQVSTPGSGTTPIAFPSPGSYELAKCADKILKGVPIPRSIFLSKSNRFPDSVAKHCPGPGKNN